MGFCTNCGHELGDGRFCTGCGHPVVGPAPAPTTPPAPQAGQVPPAPRYPLFAHEVVPPPTSPPPTSPPPAAPPEPPAPSRRPRPVWPFAVAALALVVVVGLVAGVALLSDDSSSRPAATIPGGTKHTRSATPSGDGITAAATVTVPATAPPNQDVSGKPTTYDAANLLDGVPETCWRMPGDGTGTELTVTLAEQTHLRRVGMINGYAKTAQDARGKELDWYHGNRRVLSVDWVFDDGSVVHQDLADTEAVQWVDVDVTTSTVVVRLVSVSPPGSGRAGRDYTAVSDLSFVGA